MYLHLADFGRHSMGNQLSNRWWQRTDPNGDRIWHRAPADPAAVPQGGEGADGGAQSRG